MERKVLLISPHLKVQNTAYTVKNISDVLMCNQLLKGNDTGTFPNAVTRQGGAFVQPGKYASVCNYTEFRTETGSEDAKLASIFKWEIISKFQW